MCLGTVVSLLCLTLTTNREKSVEQRNNLYIFHLPAVLMMSYLILALILSTGLVMCMSGKVINPTSHPGNSSRPDKDMYVIHATVYEVGILTNKTDNKTNNPSTGTQESVTFFNTNGTHMELSGIPMPLLTNVTAQSMVGVAPISNGNRAPGTWSTLNQLTPMLGATSMDKSDTINEKINSSSLDSSRLIRNLFKRDINGSSPVKVVKGTAIIPPAVGLQSISLPPLISFNNNLSGIPVPIPNTAVVKYAKVNTLVRAP